MDAESARRCEAARPHQGLGARIGGRDSLWIVTWGTFTVKVRVRIRVRVTFGELL